MADKTEPHLFMARANKKNCLIAAEMANEIKGVMHKYDEQIPLVLALGVLRIVERELIDSAIMREE